MSIAAPIRTPATPVDTAPRRETDHPEPSRPADLLMGLLCLLSALLLTGQLWLNPQHLVLRFNRGDQALFEWLLSYQAYALTHGADPWWTTMINAPVGANLAVNTSTVLVGTLVAPITLLLGAPVAFLVVLTANLLLNPLAWYYVLSRQVTRTRAAAVLGGLFCGYAPGIISHANGHLNFSAQFLVPFIAWRVVRLTRGHRPVRDGILLALLVVAQFAIGAEMMFFTAGGCAVFVAAWAWQHRGEARRMAPTFARGLLVTALVSTVLLAYPLYLQFAGPQRYHGIGFDQRVHAEDLAAYAAFPYLSVARLLGWYVPGLAPNHSEETSFFGPVLLVLALLSAWVLRRASWVRALTITGLVFAALSFGPFLRFGGDLTSISGPFRLLWRLPVFDAALPGRLVLVVIPVIGVLLALALDRALALPPARRRLWLAGYAVALLPLVPLPIPTMPRGPVPHFFTAGTWRQYLRPGQTLLPLPPTSDLAPDGQRWQYSTGFGFTIPDGFFLGPGTDGRSRIGPIPRPTDALLANAGLNGMIAPITGQRRQQARADLAYWHIRLVVLPDPGPEAKWARHYDALLTVATGLWGTPQRVDDVLLWQVPG